MHPLTDCLVALAGTPDDSAWLQCQMVTLVHLTVDLVAPVSHSSVTVRGDEGYLDALAAAAPTPVPDIDTAAAWPAFRGQAIGWNLRASLSVPLFAGSGTAIAALNLYGHDPAAMEPLVAGVLHTYESRDPLPAPVAARLDAGGAGLIAGLFGAFAVRAVIQQAIGALITDGPAHPHRSAGAAYQVLRQRAAEKGTPLLDTATTVLAEQD